MKRTAEKTQLYNLNRMRAYYHNPENNARIKARMRAHYRKNRAYILQRTEKKRLAVKAFVDSFRCVPCQDCKQTFPAVCMDFDHRPGEQKLFPLGLATTRDMEVIKAEIAKCDVVCANCHRIRTHVTRRRKPS